MSLRIGHERPVGNSQLEVRVLPIELGRATEQGRRQKGGSVFASDQRVEEQPRNVGTDPAPKEMVHLYDDGIQDDQIASERDNEARSQLVGLVASVRGRDQRARVREDPHRETMSSRKYVSANRPRSLGPLPAPT